MLGTIDHSKKGDQGSTCRYEAFCEVGYIQGATTLGI